MNVYELRANGQSILTVEIEHAAWLPRPRLRVGWLRYLISTALQRHFHQPADVVTA